MNKEEFAAKVQEIAPLRVAINKASAELDAIYNKAWKAHVLWILVNEPDSYWQGYSLDDNEYTMQLEDNVWVLERNGYVYGSYTDINDVAEIILSHDMDVYEI